MNITLTRVKSSYIEGVYHNPKTNELFIKFKNGPVYSYDNVPAKTVAAMMKADSIGSFFHKNIKEKFHGKSREVKK